MSRPLASSGGCVAPTAPGGVLPVIWVGFPATEAVAGSCMERSTSARPCCSSTSNLENCLGELEPPVVTHTCDPVQRKRGAPVSQEPTHVKAPPNAPDFDPVSKQSSTSSS